MCSQLSSTGYRLFSLNKRKSTRLIHACQAITSEIPPAAASKLLLRSG
jgi:hypothetical protein